MTANKKGIAFEQQVSSVLEAMRKNHPERVRVRPQPKLPLYDGQYVIPDFDLQVMLLHEESCYLIECQNRKRSQQAILHKIKYVKGLSPRSTFIFVYPESIPDATYKALCSSGVMCMSFKTFVAFIARLELSLRATKENSGILDIYKQLLGQSIGNVEVVIRPQVDRIGIDSSKIIPPSRDSSRLKTRHKGMKGKNMDPGNRNSR